MPGADPPGPVGKLHWPRWNQSSWTAGVVRKEETQEDVLDLLTGLSLLMESMKAIGKWLDTSQVIKIIVK